MIFCFTPLGKYDVPNLTGAYFFHDGLGEKPPTRDESGSDLWNGWEGPMGSHPRPGVTWKWGIGSRKPTVLRGASRGRIFFSAVGENQIQITAKHVSAEF